MEIQRVARVFFSEFVGRAAELVNELVDKLVDDEGHLRVDLTHITQTYDLWLKNQALYKGVKMCDILADPVEYDMVLEVAMREHIPREDLQRLHEKADFIELVMDV